MKLLLIIFPLSLLFLTNCGRKSGLSFSNPDQHSVIAIQPLNTNYESTRLDSIANELSHFYNSRTIILKPLQLPEKYYNNTLKQYNADSILSFLSILQNNSTVEIIGLTHERLYTIIDRKPIPYFNENLLGFSFQPGNVCVVSDHKFNGDKALYNMRLKKVIIHEVGHNLGLSDCNNLNCIMFYANGNLNNLDRCRGDYCTKCRSKIK